MSATARQRIYDLVSRIPRGRVSTYGEVARLAGLSGHARQVGYALAALPAGAAVPWQRVVNARGRISFPEGSELAELQRGLLEAEGVRFGADGRLDLARFAWRPAAHERSAT